ncbi:MAG: FliO/MopB family protein [Magnetococcales bacterium]|nr:FliO/MopB family protein [Magnetococcales bacterium]
MTSSLVRVVGFLLLFLIATAVAVRVGKRWNIYPGKADTVPIQLLGGRNFAPGVGVRLIQIGNRCWLVGVTREQVSLLTEITEYDSCRKEPTQY